MTNTPHDFTDQPDAYLVGYLRGMARLGASLNDEYRAVIAEAARRLTR